MPKLVYDPVKVGNVYGRWTVIALDANPLYVMCRCSCENKTERRVNKKNLKAGLTKSCSCWIEDHKKTHGMSRTRTYRLWNSMRNRVRLNTYYQEKGITICERWLGSEGFANFLADMGECPPDKKSLDRYPDPAGNYEPGNCRWANDKEQQRNKTTCNFQEYKGERLTVAEWAEKTGIKASTILGRMDRGWTFERAITTPQGIRRGRGSTQTKDRLIEYKGKTQTLAQWAVEFGLHISTMIDRVWRKWPMEKIERTPQGYRSDHQHAVERDKILKGDPSLTVEGETVIKYVGTTEAAALVRAILDRGISYELEAMINAVHGGARPLLRLPGSIATKFAIRPDPV